MEDDETRFADFCGVRNFAADAAGGDRAGSSAGFYLGKSEDIDAKRRVRDWKPL
jgi:hypothetical protein